MFFVLNIFLFSLGGILAQDAPVFNNCPTNILHVIPFGQGRAQVSWIEPTSPDPSVSVSSNHEPPKNFDLGKERVSYVFVKNGVSSTCEFTVEIQEVDTTPPVVTGCPRDAVATIGYLEDAVPVLWTEPSTTDNAGTSGSVTQTHQPGDLFPRGFSFVNSTFTDVSGNEFLCSFTVTVSLVDVTPPVISGCPMDIVRDVSNHRVFEAVTWTEPTATDESPSGVVNLIRQSHTSGDQFRAGVTNVLYVFEDGSQNKAVCTFQIHLSPMESPMVHTCPRSIIYDQSGQQPQLMEPQFITSNAISVDLITTANKTYQRIDRTTGNTIICSYEVFPFTVDKEPPTASSCSIPDHTRVASLGQGGTAVTYSQTTTYASISHPDGSFFPVGETVVAYVLEDDGGNIRVCSFRVLITPTITNCPPSTIYGQSKTEGVELRVFWPSPSVRVQATANPASHATGSLFPLGRTEVTHSFSQGTSEESCVFDIDVRQENPLAIEMCPLDKTVMLPEDSSEVQVTWMRPVITNRAERTAILVKQSHELTGGTFTLGNTTVTYTYEDSREPAKFTIECTFVVMVEDITEPEITGCEEVHEMKIFGWYGTFEWESSSIEVTDNSGEVKVTTSPGPDYQYPLEETMFNLTAVDSSGNQATCETILIFSLILPLPVLIALAAAAIILAALVFCCCCCCCCRGNNKDDDVDGHQGNQQTSQQPARKTSSPQKADFPEGNSYVTQVAPTENAMDNQAYKPDMGDDSTYTHIKGEAVHYTKDGCVPPPVPSGPRPTSGDQTVKPVGDNPAGGSYLTPKDTSHIYLYAVEDNPDSHRYLYPDAQTPQYNYAYDHTNRSHESVTLPRTNPGHNYLNEETLPGRGPQPARRNIPSYLDPI